MPLTQSCLLDSSLAVGQSLVVPTRHTTGTLIEGNYAQCAQAVSHDVSFTQDAPIVVPGQYALAAIDGSNAVCSRRHIVASRKSRFGADALLLLRQPGSRSETLQLPSLLTCLIPRTSPHSISTGEAVRCSSRCWSLFASRPSLTVPPPFTDPAISVTITAGLTLTNQTSVASQNITISAPFDAATAEVVSLKPGNTTDIRLSQGVQARFVNVTIEGSYLADGQGATIAEFAAM